MSEHHVIRWTDCHGHSGETAVVGSLFKARAVWAVQFEPHGFRLVGITRH